MILEFGGEEFVVEPEIDFIQRRECYRQGNNCQKCPEYNCCVDELDFVYNQLEKQDV